ncbi:Tyrosine recombinase XerC [Zhongshania aliphaticivorans]|uniref:Tyrosine recombinase XerC n=1 Tax=Zhongshania aliphaticivorans TaxID=1470434 RepID=A0A5S9Q1L7_9GAMM|nr:hypothetical protein [Zhongshania aliphaticivorans]CAA0110701.1 Tyrosine recombinase XerC [Zhongshania aliphaticivorans]CAA0118263.1 Tyrosine recombinase XerC [Zhongshania aliphaticivorans]CAA0122280.1 Tyrosine recombinase XerC [Zhongshania aliphaticivorans]
MKEDTQDWHKIDEKPVTFRLPSRYEGISDWAIKTGFHDELEVAYFCLGRPEDPRVIHNFASEFAQPISEPILSEWADKPIVSRLREFSETLSNTSEHIPKADSPISHKGKSAKGTKSEFSPLTSRYYLLAMIVNPRSHSDQDKIAESRQRFRLWLILQAAIRVAEEGCISDSNISWAARHITLDRIDPKWEKIDELLTRARHETQGFPNTFQWFNYAIEKAASGLAAHADDSDKRFLGAISPIARGYCSPLPISVDVDSPGIYPQLGSARTEGLPLGLLDPELPAIQNLPSVADNDEDESDDTLVEVDSSDTDEEQALTSRSVFLYSAEESQYLPWSWDKLLPPELLQFEAWLENTVSAKELVQSLGAAIAKIGALVGRSLYHAQRIEIDATVGDDWRITPDYRHVQRRPPRRHSAWRPQTPQEQAEVHPYSEIIRLALPQDITSALGRVTREQPPSKATLGSLWSELNPATKITTWFDGVAKEQFPRVTSGKLAQVAAQRVFENTGDHNLARIVTALPQSGLPAACGYANWDVSTIAKGLDLPVVTDNVDLATLMLGSLLAPIESVLSQGIAEAKSMLVDARDLVSFHNRYTQYCLLALYAGTGSRYLKSPFELLDHFNFKLLCAYINDKSDGARHNGRIVPLPEQLAKLLAAYLDYLARLQKDLEALRPELAGKLLALLERKGGELPLFFFLDEQLSWHQTSDGDLLGLPIVGWSLPPNLFRHRYSQRLSRADVPCDVIDGWMGHSERGGAAYGDYSPRCWINDADQYRLAYNAIYDSLGFDVIGAPAVLPSYLGSRAKERSYIEPSIYGLKERALYRRQRYRKARKIAQQEIKLFIREQELEDLNPTEIEKLGNRMLKRENGLPHPDAGIRFRVLEQFLKSRDSKHTRSIRKKILKREEERNLIAGSLPADLDRYGNAKQWAEHTTNTIQKGAVNKTTALIVGTMLLCIDKRLSYRSMLLDVLSGRNFRLIQHKKKYFIEYSEEWDTNDFNAPVQRHEISYKTASLFHFGCTNSRLADLSSLPIPPELYALATYISPDVEKDGISVKEILTRLTKIIGQANLIELPGVVAGALSERMPPTSLNWQDVFRLQHGICITLPNLEPNSDVFQDFRFNQRVAIESDARVLQDNAKELYNEVTNILGRYEKKSAKKIAKEIHNSYQAYSGKVSSSILMVACWISHVIEVGKGRGKHYRPYAKKTVQSYFSTLRLAFQGIAYSCDLLSMDSDEITDRYHDMVEFRRDRDKEVGYFGKRLKAFHRWAVKLGVKNADWSEIDTEDNHRTVSPGCISEKEYLACQEYIRTAYGEDSQLALYLGFVLLLIFRFGLRGNEALGLRRQDWCQWQGFTWVLIRDNRIRQLKRKSSRRAVPLLFNLTPHEIELIEKVLANYDSIAGTEKNAPILCEVRGGRVDQWAACREIQETLIFILRAVTGSKTLTPHHCRHAFYNHIAPILLGFETSTGSKLCKTIDTNTLLGMVLGRHQSRSIRSSIGLARLMGHSGASSGLKNYNHLMTEWADSLTPVRTERALVINGIVNTAEFDRIHIEKLPQVPDISFQKPTLLLIFKLLRLVAQGRSYQSAGKLVALHPDFVCSVQANFDKANEVMRFKKRGENSWFKGEDSPNAIVHYINDSAWIRFIELAEKFETFRVSGCPAVDELPLLLGMNRQLKMSHDRHCKIVKHTFDILGIESNRYDVYATKDDPVVTSFLVEQGFQVKTIESVFESGKSVQLDVFKRPVEERRGGIYDYGAIILGPTGDGVVRNSFEMTVGFLAVSIMLVWGSGGDSEIVAVS